MGAAARAPAADRRVRGRHGLETTRRAAARPQRAASAAPEIYDKWENIYRNRRVALQGASSPAATIHWSRPRPLRRAPDGHCGHDVALRDRPSGPHGPGEVLGNLASAWRRSVSKLLVIELVIILRLISGHNVIRLSRVVTRSVLIV